MKQGSVTIIYCNENADSITASAGRISTTAGGANEIYDKSRLRDQAENIRLIHKIVASGHTSILEHAFVNLAFDHVSVFVEQFMIEFRLASFTVKSRRYVDFGNMGFVRPDFDKYGPGGKQIKAAYESHMEYLFQEYKHFTAQGIPKEDARFVLPYAFRSNFYCTVNARELLKIVNEMVWGRGKKYPELAALGRSLIRQCESELPFLRFGPSGEDTDRKHNIINGLSGDRENGQGTVLPKDLENEQPVVLLNGPEDPEAVICRAAALALGGRNWRQAVSKDSEMQKEMIGSILGSSRKRELEQVCFTILFQHVSLAGVTHIVRHRMQSVIVPEYIYICDLEKYIVPESISKNGLEDRYRAVFARSQKVVEQLRAMGLSDHDYVYLLLSGLTVPVMTTMNGNELFTFIRLRSCNRAQWEIRECTKLMLKVLRERYPVLFSMYGPACYVFGSCPEGRLSCGQEESVRRAFATKDSNE